MEKLTSESVPTWKKPRKLMRNTPTGSQEALHATFIDGTQPRPVVIVKAEKKTVPPIAPTRPSMDPDEPTEETQPDQEPELEPIVITEPVVLTEAERERLRQEKKKARRLARKEKEKAGK